MRLIRSSSSVETRPSSTISSWGVSAGLSPSWTFAFVSSLDFSCAILLWQSARRISASASFIFFHLQIDASDVNESKYLAAFEKIGCGRRSRTFIFEFKVRRVAGYTIPQRHFRFLISDCRLVSNARSQLKIGNWQSKMLLTRSSSDRAAAF